MALTIRQKERIRAQRLQHYKAIIEYVSLEKGVPLPTLISTINIRFGLSSHESNQYIKDLLQTGVLYEDTVHKGLIHKGIEDVEEEDLKKKIEQEAEDILTYEGQIEDQKQRGVE